MKSDWKYDYSRFQSKVHLLSSSDREERIQQSAHVERRTEASIVQFFDVGSKVMRVRARRHDNHIGATEFFAHRSSNVKQSHGDASANVEYPNSPSGEQHLNGSDDLFHGDEVSGTIQATNLQPRIGRRISDLLQKRGY